ncbi:DotD/TraH family lipoprotein [Acetobacter conturbans]|uniref:DotD/TraH family lipoprotein n=1 Tax=Acetobacter conturbans TaxID=1737472 RepID=A0ABX0K4B5_9PROT|nr:DotD/TraH family lipoprotein [Acetobacter conturbans]NHN89974.1 DotD/TraH family lipoprotein [Acetobacter conturbans]
MNRHHLFAPALLLCLAACSTPGHPGPVETTGMPNTELALQRAIQSTDHDMAEFGALRPTVSVPATTADNAQVPEELRRSVWFVWKGPLLPGVKKLGREIGYTVATRGDREDVPVDINTTAPVLDHLRALGDQAGNRATVAVDPVTHSITVTYNG